MKIAFDAKRAFQNSTGLGNYSRFVIESLIENTPEHLYFAYTPKVKLQFSPKSLVLRQPNSFVHRALPALWRSGGLISDLKRDEISVFHGLSNELPSGLAQAGIKSVVTIHDLIFERFPAFYPYFDRQIYHHKFKTACQNADAIVAVSQQTKQDIIAFYGIAEDKINVIYQDCDVAFQKLSSEEEKQGVLKLYGLDKPYILCVATITERKNQLALLKAYHELGRRDIELVLVGGKSSYQQILEAYIQAHNLSNQVKILNKVPFNHLPALYQSARVFAYLSVFEGFGIPIVEALHSRVPVLATTGSCLEEAGGKGALYVAPNDISGASDSLNKLLDDENLRKKMIDEGQNHVRRFAAEKSSRELAAIYQKIQQ